MNVTGHTTSTHIWSANLYFSDHNHTDRLGFGEVTKGECREHIKHTKVYNMSLRINTREKKKERERKRKLRSHKGI